MPQSGTTTPVSSADGPVVRGRLHVVLGTAPGVGKTYAMLAEAQRLAASGAVVAVGLAETHGRSRTEEMLQPLARVAPLHVRYGGTSFEELDVDAVLVRHPDVVVVDELAHRCVPGSRHEKRWEDIEELLDAGIDVITSLNVQHIDSLHDAVESAIGVSQEETVPDAVVATADEVEFIDVTPEQLRARIADLDVLASESRVSALGGFYSSEHLDVLRRMGLAWLEDHGLLRAGAPTTGRQVGEGDERVVVALTGAPEAEHVLRRAAQIAASVDGSLIGVYVRVPSDAVESPPPWLSGQRRLLEELGGRYTELTGIDVATSLLKFARSEGARQLVLGASRRSRPEELRHGSVINKAIRGAGPIEVHVIPRPSGERPSAPVRRAPRPDRVLLPARRRQAAWVAGVVAPLALTLALVPVRSSMQLSGVLLCNLLVVVGVALLGGIRPAILATAIAFLASDFLYAPPLHSLRVDRLDDLVALIAFVLVAAAVGALVDVLTRQGVRVAQASVEGENLARLAADTLAGQGDETDVIASLRRTFGLDGVSILVRTATGWQAEAAVGEVTIGSLDDAGLTVDIGRGRLLALAGSRLNDKEAVLLRTFLDELRYAREQAILASLGSTPDGSAGRENPPGPHRRRDLVRKAQATARGGDGAASNP